MTVAVFDGHNDLLTNADHADFIAGRPNGHIDLPRMQAGGMRGGIFAIFTHSTRERKTPVRRTDGVLEFTLDPEVSHTHAAALGAAAAGRLFALERQGVLAVAREIEDLDRAHDSDGPPVAVLHLEGAEPIDEGLEALDFWYAAGLRSLGPVWSRPNRFGHGVPFIYPSSPDTGPGLTEAGIRLVRRCAELGVMVDAAHLNEAGFWDIARLELGPLVVSHACAHALAAASRNLTDKQIDAVGTAGGLVGVTFANRFLRSDFGGDPQGTPVSLIAEHARYVADRIGVEHLALGSDFDGTDVPAGVGSAAGLPNVLEALRQVGFTEAEVSAIAWENWRRVLAAWWR
jgi:membrane dipeptidase